MRMYIFSSRFGLVMTFVHEKKKFTYPTPEHLVLFHQDIKPLRFLLAPETKIFSCTEHSGHLPSWSTILGNSPSVCAQEPLSQDHTALPLGSQE